MFSADSCVEYIKDDEIDILDTYIHKQNNHVISQSHGIVNINHPYQTTFKYVCIDSLRPKTSTLHRHKGISY
jgi:hypothetical protein